MILPPTHRGSDSNSYEQYGLSPQIVKRALDLAAGRIARKEYTPRDREVIAAIDAGAQVFLDQIADCQRITAEDLATRVY